MFLYGELSVVISAMAVWMDLKDASVDNGWILFSFMIGFLIQVTENGPKGGVIFLAGVAVPVLLLGIPFIFHMSRREISSFCAHLAGSWGRGQLWNVLFILCLQVQAFLWQFLFLQAVSAEDSFIYISI